MDSVGMFDSLVDVVVASGWVYALILAISALDAAVIGDNAAYVLGRVGQGRLADRLLRSPRWRERAERAEQRLTRRAGTIIISRGSSPAGGRRRWFPPASSV
jgi:membrane protein DedA with SNARE-associated domain